MSATPRDRLLLPTAIVSLLLFVAMVAQSARLDPSVVCLQFTYDRTAFGTVLERWQDAGIARFLDHFWIDFPYLASYGLLGYLVATRTRLFAALAAGRRRFFTYCLPAAAVADGLENVGHIYLATRFATAPDWLFPVAGAIATSKWLLIAAFCLGAAHAWVRRQR